MTERKFKIELLAPAKDKNCAITAIDCGADAIYMGAGDFGARKNAANSLEDIKEVIDYAHKFNVKIYVTVNTLLFDDEIEKVKTLINKLYELKVDAVIIQDMGILETEIPPIPLHASTQCHNADLDKIQFLEKTGFSRAILARELSLEEIKNIAQNTNIELECFIQGALCVSYSGQCYMSYAIGGRSANRGECAQPCRKKYSLLDKNGSILAKDKYLLCLKDFNASEYLEQLIDIGVSSFKIEGRLKDENYIKNTVSFYRHELDRIIAKKGLERASYGISETDFTPDLNKTFNRGFCSFFLNGRNKNITSFDSPKNIGEYIGTVDNLKSACFSLKTGTLNVNDGITFFNGQKVLCGTKIEKAEKGFFYPNSMKDIVKGAKIFRNLDYNFLKQLEKSSPKRKIPVDISVFVNDKAITVVMNDFYGNGAKTEFENCYEPANNQEQAEENFKKQLSKLGATEFILNKIEIRGETLPFIKINEINDIRHKIVDIFRKNKIKTYTLKKQKPINHPKLDKKLDYKENITNECAKKFYQKCGGTFVEYGLEHKSQNNYNGKTVMTTKHCIKYSLDFCSKTGKKLNEPLFLKDETGKNYRLEFDCKNCLMKVIY